MNQALLIGGIVLAVTALALILYFMVFRKKAAEPPTTVKKSIDTKDMQKSLNIGIIPDTSSLSSGSTNKVSGYAIQEYYTCGADNPDTTDMNKFIWIGITWKNPSMLTDSVTQWYLELTPILANGTKKDPYSVYLFNTKARGGYELVRDGPIDIKTRDGLGDVDPTNKKKSKQVRVRTSDKQNGPFDKQDVYIGPDINDDGTIVSLQSPVPELFENDKYVTVEISLGKACKGLNMFRGKFELKLQFNQVPSGINLLETIISADNIEVPDAAFSCNPSDLPKLKTINYTLITDDLVKNIPPTIAASKRYPVLFSLFNILSASDKSLPLTMSSLYTLYKNGTNLSARPGGYVFGPFVNDTQFYLVQSTKANVPSESFSMFMLDSDNQPLYVKVKNLDTNPKPIVDLRSTVSLILEPGEANALSVYFINARLKHDKSEVSIGCYIKDYKANVNDAAVGDTFIIIVDLTVENNPPVIMCHPTQSGSTRACNLIRTFDFNSISTQNLENISNKKWVTFKGKFLNDIGRLVTNETTSSTVWTVITDDKTNESAISCTGSSGLRYMNYIEPVDDAKFGTFRLSPAIADSVNVKLLKISGGAGNLERDFYLLTTKRTIGVVSIPYRAFRLGKSKADTSTAEVNRVFSGALSTYAPGVLTQVFRITAPTVAGQLSFQYASLSSMGKYLLHNIAGAQSTNRFTADTFNPPAGALFYTVGTPGTTAPFAVTVSGTAYTFSGTQPAVLTTGTLMYKTANPELETIKTALINKTVCDFTSLPDADDILDHYVFAPSNV
jgi:hypothetical protein